MQIVILIISLLCAQKRKTVIRDIIKSTKIAVKHTETIVSEANYLSGIKYLFCVRMNFLKYSFYGEDGAVICTLIASCYLLS